MTKTSLRVGLGSEMVVIQCKNAKNKGVVKDREAHQGRMRKNDDNGYVLRGKYTVEERRRVTEDKKVSHRAWKKLISRSVRIMNQKSLKIVSKI